MRKIFIVIIILSGISSCANAQSKVPMSNADFPNGETVTICDKMVGDALILDPKTSKVLINFGNAKQRKVKVIFPAEMVKKLLDNSGKTQYQNFCITGKLQNNNGQPELVVMRSSDVKLCQPASRIKEIMPNDFMSFE